MLRQALMPNVITYNALIGACGKGQERDKALQLFKFVAYGLDAGRGREDLLAEAEGRGRLDAETAALCHGLPTFIIKKSPLFRILLSVY